jgi:hypothetical protein
MHRRCCGGALPSMPSRMRLADEEKTGGRQGEKAKIGEWINTGDIRDATAVAARACAACTCPKQQSGSDVTRSQLLRTCQANGKS